MYCKGLPGETLACKKALHLEKDGQRKKLMNTRAQFEAQTSPHIYDYLAVEAYYNGLVSNSTSYREVVQAAERFQERTLGLTVDDLPTRCLDPKNAERIRELSFKNSQSFYKGNMNEFLESYENFSRQHFCSIDFEKILEEKRWQVFFKSMV